MTPPDDALEQAKAAEEQAEQDRTNLAASGFLALRLEVAGAIKAVEAVGPDTYELVIRQAERRRDELAGTKDGDPASIDLELAMFRAVLECRRVLADVAKRQQAHADIRAGANGGKGIRDRMPRRGR